MDQQGGNNSGNIGSTGINSNISTSNVNFAAAPLIPKQKLMEMISLVAPGERLDPPVEMMLNKIGEEFVLSIGKHAIQLAKHRKSTIVEGRDVNLALGILSSYFISYFSDEL